MYKFALALLLVGLTQTLAQSQRAVLYEGRNSGGEYLIVPQSYVPNLAQYNFDNRVNSVCVTGTWVLYVNNDYNINNFAGVEFVFGPNNYCTNLQTIGGYVSSVRFVGSANDYRSDTITIFEGDYFQGAEEYSFIDMPNLALAGNHKSIIITGTAAWTVYDSVNYGGNSICLYPPTSNDYRPYFISDVISVSIPHGTIRSVRKGCWGKASDNVADFARGGSA